MTNWHEIYTKYLQGVKPKELSEIYKIPASKISKKIYNEKLKTKKTELTEKIIESLEKKIENLTNKAFCEVEKILNDSDATHSNKIQAAKLIFDISGLKKDNKELSKNLSYEVIINHQKIVSTKGNT